MATSWTAIATTTVTTAQTISFTSIPQTYTDLVLYYTGRESSSNVSAGNRYTFNSASSTYSMNSIYIQGNTQSSDNFTSYSYVRLGEMPANTATANYFGAGIITVFNYAGGTWKSTFHRWHGVASASNNTSVCEGGAQWQSQAAITSMQLLVGQANFMPGSKATLFGITKTPL